MHNLTAFKIVSDVVIDYITNRRSGEFQPKEESDLLAALKIISPDPDTAAAWNPNSHWDDHYQYPTEDWKDEVMSGDTRQSYKEWVNSKIEAEPPTQYTHLFSVSVSVVCEDKDWDKITGKMLLDAMEDRHGDLCGCAQLLVVEEAFKYKDTTEVQDEIAATPQPCTSKWKPIGGEEDEI